MLSNNPIKRAVRGVTPWHAVVVLALLLVFEGCGLFSDLADGHKKADAAATAIEMRLGTKPEISFGIFNGNLGRVAVTFSAVPAAPLSEIEKIAREEVQRAFEAKPENLVISFAFKQAAQPGP